MLKKTPLNECHIELKARLVDFSGWEMPVQYPTGILKEHATTREAIGLFDTCHMGEFVIEADNVRGALNCALAGDFTKMKAGRERYTFITNKSGGVIDDAVVMIYSDTKAMMIVNAGDIEGDFEAVSKHLPQGASIQNISNDTGKLDVQGPKAWELVKEVTGVDFRTMPFYSFIETEWNGVPLVVSRSGYTGEPGAEFYLPADKTVAMWNELMEKGEKFGALPCGLGARDTLRLEAGLPLYGHEMTVETNPIQAGFGKFVKLEKDENFPGKDALKKVAEAMESSESGPDVLIGLKMDGKRVPRAGFDILDNGEKTGIVTSGAPGPTVGSPLALGYVKQTSAQTGKTLAVDIRGKALEAQVVELPFYSNPDIRKKS